MESAPLSLSNQNSQVKYLPKRFNLLNSDLQIFKDKEKELCEDWVSYMDNLHRKKFILYSESEKIARVYRGTFNSRYHKSGQRKIKRKIKNRLGHYYFKAGVRLGMTLKQSMSRYEAWRDVGDWVRSFMDELNKYRSRKGLKTRLSYLSVLEEQENGYPHVHILFSGLRSLASIPVIDKLWVHGSTNVEYVGGHRAADYSCKYITKMEGKELMMAYLYGFRRRLYNMSRTYKVRGEDIVSDWKFLKLEKGEGIKDQVKRLMGLGYYIEGISILEMAPERPP